jgi:hypothetical protein
MMLPFENGGLVHEEHPIYRRLPMSLLRTVLMSLLAGHNSTFSVHRIIQYW